MDIFLVDTDLDYQSVLLESDEIDELDENGYFCGKLIGELWNPPKVKLKNTCVNEVGYLLKKVKVPPGDYPHIYLFTPVFSERAVNVLHKYLESNGELLELKCKEMKLYLYNIHQILDAIDIEQSVFERYDSGAIRKITKYSFKKNILDDIPIFKIKQFPSTNVFVNQSFYKDVMENNLKGFLFKKIWSG